MQQQTHAQSLVVALCVALVFLPTSGGVGAPAPGIATFSHDDGGAATGDINGTMNLLRARLSSSSIPGLTMHDMAARLEIVQVRYNITRIAGVTAFQEQIIAEYTTRTIPLSADRVQVVPDPDALVAFHGPGFPLQNPEPLPVTVEAQGIDWSPARLRAQGEAFWYHTRDSPLVLVDSFAVPHRTATISQGQATTMHGPWSMHLRDVDFIADDQRIVIDPHFQLTQYTSDPTDRIRRAQVTLTEAFLFVDEGSTTVPTGGALFDVGDTNLTVDGDAVFHGATGNFSIGSTSGSLSHQTLGLRGVFRLDEQFPDVRRDGSQRPEVQSVAAGSFSVLAADYIVEAAGPAGPSLLEQAVWLTLSLGVLGFLAWLLQHAWVFLYSRINEDAVLEHPRRAQIMGFVEANPGCHVLRVAEDLGLARGVARHHLMVLERAGRLERFHESGQTLLVPAGQDKAVALRAWAEEDPHLGTIRRVVAAGGVRRAELVATLRRRHGVADPTARRWIEKAVRAGLIDEHGKGHGVTYHAAS